MSDNNEDGVGNGPVFTISADASAMNEAFSKLADATAAIKATKDKIMTTTTLTETSTNEEIAKAVCELLKERKDSDWSKQLKTGRIARLVGLGNAKGHTAVRHVLSTLSDNDVVVRMGTGSFWWELREDAVNDWQERINKIDWKRRSKATTRRAKSSTSIDSKELEALRQRLTELEVAVNASVRTIEIKHEVPDAEDKVVSMDGVSLPKVFDRVLALAKARRNIMLVGPAGCGKTFIGKLISKALDLTFGSVSCTAGMSETALTGRGVPNITTGETEFQYTEFLECYEEGGVFLLDEIDAADPNLLLVINTAIANGYCNVPNRPENPQAIRHKDFVLITTANTFGRGANRMYAGRAQLDEATLDRFRIGMIEVDYDENVEKALCPEDTIREPLQAIRRNIENAGLRRIMSTRFIEDAYIMHKVSGWSLLDIQEAYFEGWSDEEKRKALTAATIDSQGGVQF